MDGGFRTIERGSAPLVSVPRTAAPERVVSPVPSTAARWPDLPYPRPAALPTQIASHGIRFDFNVGARVVLPNRASGKWRIRLGNLDTGNVLFPYAARFAAVHGCRLTCAMSGLIIPLLREAYPDIRFVTHEEPVEQKLEQVAYAKYCLGLFFDDADNVWQPTDFRLVGLHRTAVRHRGELRLVVGVVGGIVVLSGGMAIDTALSSGLGGVYSGGVSRQAGADWILIEEPTVAHAIGKSRELAQGLLISLHPRHPFRARWLSREASVS